MIQTIGDSHCWHGWLKIPGVNINLMGPMTMHSVGRDKPYILSSVPKEDDVIFCWGEIDCRCHVHKHQPWEECIEGLVKNYVEALKINSKDHKKIWIYNVVPPPRKNLVIQSPGFPFEGEDEDRLKYVKRMNELLKKSEFGFVDVYDKYSDEEGFLKIPMSDLHVHIADEKPLAEWVEKNINGKR